jgi:hypothetical protein
MSPTKQQQELLEILRMTRGFLARPENDFAWSSWENAPAALRELDGIISGLESGSLPERSLLGVLFAPTGPIQEVSLSSGWGEEFLTLARRYDHAANRIYRPDTRRSEAQRAELAGYVEQLIGGKLRWFCAVLFVISLGFVVYLQLAHATAEIYFPVRMSGRAALITVAIATFIYGVLGLMNWFSWFKKKRK